MAFTPQIVVVTGGQYGSEGKGAFIHHLAQTKRGDWNIHIRVGGPQAGHSLKTDRGDILKLTTVPVGAATEGTLNLIGPMSVVDIEKLAEEIDLIEQTTKTRPTVVVDPRATILDKETAPSLEEGLVEQIGSTGKGVGAARSARIGRFARTAGDEAEIITHCGALVEDTAQIARSMLADNNRIVVEAAQGQLLSLHTGYRYPFVTSAECGPAQAFVDAGLPLRYARKTRTYGVFRTLPIRVGGNSGPMGGTEINWDLVQALYGDHIPVERTTVTDRVRRISTWDPAEVAESVAYTDIDGAVLSFVDYIFPEIEGHTQGQLPLNVEQFVKMREAQIGVPVRWIGTSFGTYYQRTTKWAR